MINSMNCVLLLSSWFTDRLCCDNTDSLTLLNKTAVTKVKTVT